MNGGKYFRLKMLSGFDLIILNIVPILNNIKLYSNFQYCGD